MAVAGTMLFRRRRRRRLRLRLRRALPHVHGDGGHRRRAYDRDAVQAGCPSTLRLTRGDQVETIEVRRRAALPGRGAGPRGGGAGRVSTAHDPGGQPRQRRGARRAARIGPQRPRRDGQPLSGWWLTGGVDARQTAVAALNGHCRFATSTARTRPARPAASAGRTGSPSRPTSRTRTPTRPAPPGSAADTARSGTAVPGPGGRGAAAPPRRSVP